MKEAIKLMLHEMEYVLSCINENKIPFDGDDFHEALRLGQQAFAEAVVAEQHKKKEPVAWMNDEGDVVTDLKWAKDQGYVIPLYTTPYIPTGRQQRTWVGLTDIEINDLVHNHDDFDGLWEFADAVEAKLKQKNT